MSLPATYQLRNTLPKTIPLHILCPAKLVGLWQNVAWVDTVIPFNRKRLTSDEQKNLKKIDPDATLVFPNSFASLWDLWRCGLKPIIGRRGQGRSLFLHHSLAKKKRNSHSTGYHQARDDLIVAAACGSQEWDWRYPPLKSVLDRFEESAIAHLMDKAIPLLILAPGAAYGPAKQWPPQSFNQIAQWWSKQGGFILVIGTQTEVELGYRIIQHCSNSINMAGKTSLAQLLRLFHKSDCVISNDSGPMHLAAATNCRGIALFGSTDPMATGPLGGRWTILHQPPTCSPCFRRRCYRNDHPYECLNSIHPEQLISHLSHTMKQ